MAIRRTIRLEEHLFNRARPFMSSRGLSRFVNQALAEKVEALERQQVESAMREGYLATRRDREALNEDWQALDGEEWPE